MARRTAPRRCARRGRWRGADGAISRARLDRAWEAQRAGAPWDGRGASGLALARRRRHRSPTLVTGYTDKLSTIKEARVMREPPEGALQPSPGRPSVSPSCQFADFGAGGKTRSCRQVQRRRLTLFWIILQRIFFPLCLSVCLPPRVSRFRLEINFLCVRVPMSSSTLQCRRRLAAKPG